MDDYERIEVPVLVLVLDFSPDTRGYMLDGVKVFVSREKHKVIPGQTSEYSLHISISRPDKYPTWDEIKEARYRFMPRDRDAYMILPKEEDYVNYHPNCFHIWMPDIK